MTKALVSLSGGMDSATVLGLALSKGLEVECVGFYYNSKHNLWENKAAEKIAQSYGVLFTLIDLSGTFAGISSHLMRGGGVLPEGHYEAESMKQTVVPGRNIIFISILSGLAMSEGFSEVWMGVHSGDHAIYPDCRPEFVHYMSSAIYHGTDKQVRLMAPFLPDNKTTILQKGYSLDPPVPYHLTRTCYSSDEVACGRCGACQERLAAYKAIGKEDPIAYQSREIMEKR